MALIELENVTKVYHSGGTAYPALRGVSLSIGTGEFAAIMGASGSGKTTLLNLIGCMGLPTSGIYRFDGVDMSRAGENQLAQIRGRRIAFVFQNFAFCFCRYAKCRIYTDGVSGMDAGSFYMFHNTWNKYVITVADSVYF